MVYDLTAIDSVRKMLSTLKVNCAISHWEFIVTSDDRLALVETQLRPAGDAIPSLIDIATGVCPYRSLFQLSLNHAFVNEALFAPKQAAFVAFLHPESLAAGRELRIQTKAPLPAGCSLRLSDDLQTLTRWEPELGAAKNQTECVSLANECARLDSLWNVSIPTDLVNKSDSVPMHPFYETFIRDQGLCFCKQVIRLASTLGEDVPRKGTLASVLLPLDWINRIP
jgi:hypothetical protein